MPTNKTIYISTKSGLEGTVWMGSNDNWQIATDPALYDLTLTGKSEYWLGHIGQGVGGNDGNIGF